MNRLIDRFGRVHNYLRISITDRCNLRCRYCMPNQGMVFKPRKELLTYEEIERIARVFVRLGIDKIRITGGEPLVRKDLPRLIDRLHAIDGVKTLAMTTNATLLAGVAAELKEKGLSALNISLDTFSREKFQHITQRDDFDEVIKGLKAALAAGFDPLKLNVVAISGFNDDEILNFAQFAFENRINVRFIEYMPFKDNDWKADKVISFADMRAEIERHYELVAIETERSAVAKDFSMAGGVGSVSFISSMSESFCSTCNRLRLTADGSVKSCLFYPAETNLRDALRAGADDRELEEMILGALALKPEAHPPAEEIAATENRAMVEIGG